MAKEKVRKLNMIHRELSSRPSTAAVSNSKPPSNPKYAHVQGKLE